MTREGVKQGRLAPQDQPGHYSTLTVPSGWDGELKNTQLFATELSSTYTPLSSYTDSDRLPAWWSVTLEEGEQNPTQTKQTTLCLPLSWDFSSNIPRTILPTTLRSFYLFWFPFNLLLDKRIYRGRSCTRTPVSQEIGSHGRKSETTKKQSKRGQQVSLVRSSITLLQSHYPHSAKLNISSYKQLLVNVPTLTPWCRAVWVAGKPRNKHYKSSACNVSP